MSVSFVVVVHCVFFFECSLYSLLRRQASLVVGCLHCRCGFRGLHRILKGLENDRDEKVEEDKGHQDTECGEVQDCNPRALATAVERHAILDGILEATYGGVVCIEIGLAVRRRVGKVVHDAIPVLSSGLYACMRVCVCVCEVGDMWMTK